MSGASAEQFQKSLSRKKNSNKPVDNSRKEFKDKGRGKGKGKERKVEDEELGLRNGEIVEVEEVSLRPSQREVQEKEKNDNEDARRPIENGASRSRKSDGRGGGKEHQKQKKEKQSQERKDLELKAKRKMKQEGEKLRGKDTGETEVVKKKVEGTKKRKKKEDAEEEEGGVGCRFPMSRVDRIIRSEGSDYRITHEAVFLINKATEKFLEVFSEDSYKRAAQDCKKYVSYKNLSSVVSKDKSLYFLSDYIPEKVKAENALAERKQAEK